MYGADSIEDCYEITINAAVDVIGMDWCSLVAPSDEADVFEIKAISEAGTAEPGERVFGVEKGVAGYVYRTKETRCIDDVTGSDRAKPTDNTIKSALTIAVGDWGVFHAMSAETNTFDSRDINWAELLCMSLGTVLERHQREERLRSQNERITQLAGALSHDLRNPLQVVKARAKLAREDPDPHLDAIQDATDQMEALVDDLLAMIRSDTTNPEMEPVSLGQMIDHCWTHLDSETATLSEQTDRLVRADRRFLRQIFENLLTNAVVHSDGSVEVTVGTTADGFFVADDGPGIPSAKQNRVFDRGHSTATDGTGFGLNIVQEFAAAHGWDVSVTESKMGGARFDVTGVEFLD
ncbi:GAF domain-containing sensor histidine kinase [Halovenus rubra]|uniref:GAF domain-containing sensor histidine kinase n=3 Tax=Halovenus rubra TaxID=869890 RepID=A0ACC7DZV0_9EURY|nr:GAF domain-containing sensor histidine kinase [Halovenus rubra]